MMVHAEGSEGSTRFTDDYYYQKELPITPFCSEANGEYKVVELELDLSWLAAFAQNGDVKFSDIIFSVPNPNYELSINDITIVKESDEPDIESGSLSVHIWQPTEMQRFYSGENVFDDVYSFDPSHLSLEP